MSAVTTENETPETLEVSGKNISHILAQYCDGCGGTVHASYEAKKGEMVLYFCGHHIRKNIELLFKDGFEVTPEDISYEASHVEKTNL